MFLSIQVQAVNKTFQLPFSVHSTNWPWYIFGCTNLGLLYKELLTLPTCALTSSTIFLPKLYIGKIHLYQSYFVWNSHSDSLQIQFFLNSLLLNLYLKLTNNVMYKQACSNSICSSHFVFEYSADERFEAVSIINQLACDWIDASIAFYEMAGHFTQGKATVLVNKFASLVLQPNAFQRITTRKQENSCGQESRDHLLFAGKIYNHCNLTKPNLTENFQNKTSHGWAALWLRDFTLVNMWHKLRENF